MATSSSNTIWVLIAGLAVGFVVGRELPQKGTTSPGSAPGPDKAASSAGTAGTRAAPAGDQAAPEIPASWIREGDFGATEAFAGLSALQRYNVLKVLNEQPCDCGCSHGSIALCKKTDPSCPRAPTVIASAIAAARTGGYQEILAAAKKKDSPAPAAEEKPQKIELASWTPVQGPRYAKVTIVEFSDFQCPFCGKAIPTLKQVEQTYGKDLRVAFRHQPLPMHDRAREAAEAAMAANAQGKFWAMHDKLFANQSALDRPALDRYAAEIGLNLARYRADMDGHRFKDQIDADMKRGKEVGADGTPTFFVNGQPLSGAMPFDSFKTVIDAELKKADALLAKGTPMDKLYEAVLAALPATAAAPAAPPEHVDITLGDAPVKGARDAAVTLLEYSDFQCPFCGRVGPTLKQIEQEYKGKVRIAFKNRPLPFHQNAELAAEAALAANDQGKFWEMHDKLFANQSALERPALEKYAGELGLDLGRFKAALDSGKFKERVKRESAEGVAAGAGGTPTFFVNGYRLVGAQPIDAFKGLIDRELAKNKK